ncbi:MAG: hypothetical protein D6681_13440 [Calditrichaeota bacterium]|nr:MAG: hypothetical protein D6681_13440 [Calditrichota bacterium]
MANPGKSIYPHLRSGWQRVRRRTGNILYPALFALSILLFIATLLWMLWATVIWPWENTQNFRCSSDLADNTCKFSLDGDLTLDVWGPEIVPGDQDFVEIYFALQQNDGHTQPLTLVLDLPAEYTLPVSENNLLTHKVKLHFSGQHGEETHVLQIANAGIRSDIHTVIAPVKIYYGISEENTRYAGEIPLKVEGKMRTILRRFGGDGEIPFIPIIALLTSVTTYTINLKEREQRQHELEIQQANELIKTARKELQDGNISNVKHKIVKLKKQQMGNRVDALEDISTLESLLTLAEGKRPLPPSGFPPSGWENEAAMVLAYAAEHKPIEVETLLALIRAFPLDRVSEQAQTRLTHAEEGLSPEMGVETRRWPPMPEGRTDSLLKLNTSLHNPYPKTPVAENEAAWLFGDEPALFYSEHPVYNSLVRREGICLVSGAPGSGRTALALALGKYNALPHMEKTREFTCYLSHQAGEADLRQALASRLLKFLIHNPADIRRLDDEGRELCAMLLISEMDAVTVRAALANALRPQALQSREKQSTDHPQDTEEPGTERIRQAVKHTQIQLLIEETEQVEQKKERLENWIAALAICLQRLDFKHFRLVFDLNEPSQPAWYENRILPLERQMHLWWQSPFQIVFFSPQPGTLTLSPPPCETLSWSPEQLTTMLQHRWRRANGRIALSSYIPEEEVQRLVTQANGLPRSLLRACYEYIQHPDKANHT